MRIKIRIIKKDKLLNCSLVVFSLLYLSAIFLFFVDKSFYREILSEDHIVEALTSIILLIAAIIALRLSVIIKKERGFYHWFFVLFSILLTIGFLEEISFGQRILNIETPEYFVEKSSQPEINLHNLFQGLAREKFGKSKYHFFKTRTIVQHVAIAYGVFLPILVLFGVFGKKIEDGRIVIPPLQLVPGFVLGAVLLGDNPTGREEELGELFVALSFLFLIWAQLLDHTSERQQ